MSTSTPPPAMLSVDLDDHWSYLRSFGRRGWEQRPSFLTTALPRIRQCLAQRELCITVFVVGVDAEQDANREPLGALAADGHEFGNHSWQHDPAVFVGPVDRMTRDLARAESAIGAITGARTRGFRGPSFATSSALLDALCARDYHYDASSFPMSLSALAALYRRLRSHAGAAHTAAGGGLLDAWQSLLPHRVHDDRLVEFPVTTMPLVRFPIHFTYLNALGDLSAPLARNYLQLALTICRARRVPPSLLLHAADFIGADDPFNLGFLPGMRRRWTDKRRLMHELLDGFRERFDVTGLGQYLERHPVRRET